jgi:hypothetical protein
LGLPSSTSHGVRGSKDDDGVSKREERTWGSGFLGDCSRCKNSGLSRAPEVSSRFGEPRFEKDSRRSMEHCTGSQGKTARWGRVSMSSNVRFVASRIVAGAVRQTPHAVGMEVNGLVVSLYSWTYEVRNLPWARRGDYNFSCVEPLL